MIKSWDPKKVLSNEDCMERRRRALLGSIDMALVEKTMKRMEEEPLTFEDLKQTLLNAQKRRPERHVFLVPEEFIDYCKKVYPDYLFVSNYELKQKPQE